MKTAFKTLLRTVLRPWVQYRGLEDQVYLTFDDGPNPDRTRRLLEILSQHGVQATFFMIGEYAERHPELARQVIAAGHGVGFHSHAHPHMHRVPVSRQLQELRSIRRLSQQLGTAVRLYRPPYGELTFAQIVWCALHRIRIVMWSCDPHDSFTSDSTEVAEGLKAVRGGDIILLHDDTESAIAALPRALTQIRNTGLRFGRLEGSVS